MNQEPGWLFRQSDLVLGPVPAKQIVDKLYSGELTPNSEVQLMGGGSFRRLADVAEFKVHVAKAEAKMRVDAQAAQHHAAQRSKLTRVLAIAGGVLAVLLIGVALAGNYFAVHGGKSAEELAWGDISIDPPTISKARRSGGDDLVDYQATKKQGTAVAATNPTTPTGTTTATRPPPTPRPPKANDDPDGLAMGAPDEGAINAVVAKHKPTLIKCIKLIVKPDMPLTKIPIEFAISEQGRVTKVWVDNPDFKDSPLNDCLLQELQKWPFKPGASAAVNLSFNVGKRG
jgi:hypothetical protein